MPRRKHNKLLLGKISKLLVVGLTYRLWRNNKISKRKKSNIKYSYNGSRQHMACSFMPACLRCRTLVDTIVLLYELCCSVQGRLKAVLLCLRYVDWYCGFRSLTWKYSNAASSKTGGVVLVLVAGKTWNNEKTGGKNKRSSQKAKKANNFGKVLFPNK